MNKKTNNLVLLLAALILALTLNSCKQKPVQTFGFAFYNVENLFDTIDDPHVRDNEFLPDSKLGWDTKKYEHKLDNLVKVMSSIDSSGFPALFGLCEVENINVLHDLVNHNELKNAGYSIIHKDSPDERGIDVALLYQKDVYTPVVTRFIRLTFPSDPNNGTRDILYSKGVVAGKDTLHLFINHWVSRWGGQEKTEPFRKFTGNLLKKITDSILAVRPDANIIIAGDLNDNPDDVSISQNLDAKPVENPLKKKTLYNLGYNEYKAGEGSLYYRGWDMFDQIIVSTSLLSGKNKVMVNSPEQTVIKHDWMLYHPKKGPARPNRTAAKNYYGGYSDHLPVYIGITVYK
ncbi:MAG: hypothetical protein GXO86_09595 [Chlorobi bacterium]|nr:hypothetical protein [Chlorobiota bacterium]